MDTPTLKCPRSGRLLTPLSKDYWRLKKKINVIFSDSSGSDNENDETPLRKPSKPRAKTPVSITDSAQSSRPRKLLGSPNTPALPSIEETEKKSAKGPEPRQSRPRKSDTPKLVPKSTSEDGSSDENAIFKPRPRRKAQKFVLNSPSSDSDSHENPRPAPSSNDDCENLSKVLFSTRIDSENPAPPRAEPQTSNVIAISSDDGELPALDARTAKSQKKSPLRESSSSNIRLAPVTEPRKRIKKVVNSRAMPPPTAPVRRTQKARAKPKPEDDSDGSFDELLEKLRNEKHKDDVYDESQVDLNNTVCEWETSNSNDRKFLESLDEVNVPLEHCHEDALVFRRASFNAIKDDLKKTLFDLFHRVVFQNRFQSEIPVTWNERMLKTAGFCCSRRGADGTKMASIVLAPKVVDRTSRLRDVLLHEMCHAGAWLIHGYRDGHGTLFRFWVQRAYQLLGLTVTTYHTYKIEAKYIYRCPCGNEVRRHSKSLDTSRFICSRCRERFELFVNNERDYRLTPASARKQTPSSNFQGFSSGKQLRKNLSNHSTKTSA